MKRLIVNCTTNETELRDLTDEELLEGELFQKQLAAERAEILAKEVQRQEIAERLGLTPDELQVLLG